MARDRDFFRLNKQDQKDLLDVLNRDISFPDGVRRFDRKFGSTSRTKESIDAFDRLINKYRSRLFGVLHARSRS